MRIAGLAAFIGMSVLSLLVQSAPASADTDCKALVAPSPFGPDDQTGATNRVTPAVTKAAAGPVTRAVAVLHPAKDGKVEGTLTFARAADGVKVSGRISGLAPGAQFQRPSPRVVMPSR